MNNTNNVIESITIEYIIYYSMYIGTKVIYSMVLQTF